MPAMDAPSPTGLPDFDALWDYDRPAETEARFRDLLPAARASGDRDYHLQLMTQLARAQGLQRDFDGAHATLDHVRDGMADDLPAARVRYLLERGRCFNDQKAHDRARACFTEAWDVAREHRIDGHAVDAAHMMGIVEQGDAALAWNERAAALAKGSADPKARRWLASLQNNVGWTYFSGGRYAEALAAFEDALALRVEQGRPGAIRIARYAVAKALRMLGQVERSLAEQTALAAECERAGEPDGYVYEEVAECLLTLGRGAEARPQFARAYALLSKTPWLARDEPDRLERMKALGGLS